MNTGAFGEGFPYTNFHDLNMDWIIKIAKDFLDQYTHIQQIIAEGEESIQNLTSEGLQQLQDKADNLEELLQDWYTEHSEDIANQLADALEDINDTLTSATNTINTTLGNAILSFNTNATNKANEVIQSIPNDYTELSNTVESMKLNVYKENLIAYDSYLSGKVFNVLIHDWYNDTNGRYKIYPIETVNDYIHIIDTYANGPTPTVVFFNGIPSSTTYIGYDNIIQNTSDTTVINIQNQDITIPDGCTYVIIQSAYAGDNGPSVSIGMNAFEYMESVCIEKAYITSGLITGNIITTVTHDWYDSTAYGALVIPVEYVSGYLKIVKSINNNTVPAVAYFNGIPSSDTYISAEGLGTSGQTPVEINNILCNIPTTCRYIVLQSNTTSEYNDYAFEYAQSSNVARKIISDIPLKLSTDGMIFNIYTKQLYEQGNGAYQITERQDYDGELWIKKAYVNKNMPAVCYFSDLPMNSANYIGCDGKGSSSDITYVKGIYCKIPDNCKYIILQGIYNTSNRTLPEFQKEFLLSNKLKDTIQKTNRPIHYKMYPYYNAIEINTGYGNKQLSVIFGRTNANSLPDFIRITTDDNLYTAFTDWFAPFTVKADQNGDGDTPTVRDFTGGNHTHNSTKTARNIYIKFYADGKEIVDSEGYCNKLTIKWKNNVQGYNTVKDNGTGREILSELHELIFNGEEFECITQLIPLEQISIEQWYGYQAYVANSWPNITYIGGTNNITTNCSEWPTSGNSTPNKAICNSSMDVLELEIDRSYDLGKGDYYNGTSGMFISQNKLYNYIINNLNNIPANSNYGLRGWYRFYPNN